MNSDQQSKLLDITQAETITNIASEAHELNSEGKETSTFDGKGSDTYKDASNMSQILNKMNITGFIADHGIVQEVASLQENTDGGENNTIRTEDDTKPAIIVSGGSTTSPINSNSSNTKGTTPARIPIPSTKGSKSSVVHDETAKTPLRRTTNILIKGKSKSTKARASPQ